FHRRAVEGLLAWYSPPGRESAVGVNQLIRRGLVITFRDRIVVESVNSATVDIAFVRNARCRQGHVVRRPRRRESGVPTETSGPHALRLAADRTPAPVACADPI